jgi:ABC-type antimicrobial peptide transport system ATPase subunit
VVLEVRALAKSFWLKQGLFGKREFKAVQDVNFQLRAATRWAWSASRARARRPWA